MKTPQEWMNEWKAGVEWKSFQELVEIIQRDALSDSMVQTEAMRLKWLEARKHLRAANKGAERSNMAMQLAHEKLRNYWLSGKRQEQKEKHSMETRVWEWLSFSDADLRLRMGEMTSQEIRNCRALLRALLGTQKLSNKP